MKCSDVRPRLPGFLRGDMSAREIRQIATHLGRCAACMDELMSLEVSTRALRESPEFTYPSTKEPGRADEPVPALRVDVEKVVRRARHRRSRHLIAGLASLAILTGLVFWWGVARPGNTDLIAQVISVQGDPVAKDSPRGAWRPVSLQTKLSRGSSFRTGEADRLDIEAVDGTRILLDFGSEAEFVAPKGKSQRPFGVRLRSGRIWLLVAESSQRLSVETSEATAEALGTLFSVSVDQRGQADGARPRGPQAEPTVPLTTVIVLRGKVRVANDIGSQTVSEGAHVTVLRGRAPETRGVAEPLASMRVRAPWGQTGYEVWVSEPLRREGAAERMAAQRSWLGVDLAENPGRWEGCPVSMVEPGSPAEAAGLRLGDVIAQIGPVPIKQRSDLTQAEFKLPPGKDVPIRVSRAGRELVKDVRLEEHPLVSRMAKTAPSLDRANELFLRGNHEEAARLYEELSTRGEAAALNNMGVLCELEGRVREAYEYYERAALSDPGVPLYHLNLGMAYSRIGNLSRAAEELSQLAGDERMPVRVLYSSGRTLAIAGNMEAARSVAERLRVEPATRGTGCCLMGEISRLSGDPGAASVFFAEAVEANPYDPLPLVHLAAVHFGDDDLQGARDCLDRALVLAPHSLSALNRLGLVLYRQGLPDEALRTFGTALELYPDSAELQNNIGMVHFRKDEMVEAAVAYREAVRLSPRSSFCHLGLGMTLEKAGEYAAAKHEYAIVIRLDPTYADAYRSLARLHEKVGETELARAVTDQLRAYGL